MYIECHLDVDSLVLKTVLSTYIFKTPFLRIARKPLNGAGDIEGFREADLIIIEPIDTRQEDLYDLIATFKEKLFMILIDYKRPDLKDFSFENVILLPKSLTHKEFLEALSELIDRKKPKN